MCIRDRDKDVKMKAAGGVRTREDLELFLEEGCERIGTSSAIKILEDGEKMCIRDRGSARLSIIFRE